MRISQCFLLNHHRILICYSVLRVAKCWIYGGCCLGIEFRMKINEVRRTVPSFKLLKDSKVYDILIRKSSTVVLRLLSTTVIGKEHCVFNTKRRLYPVHFSTYVDFLCTKKGKSLNRIDWKFWSYGYTHRLCELPLVCAALFSKSWPYPLILLFLCQYSFRNWNNKYVHTLP